MPPGTVVCTGRYWFKPGRANRWYVPPDTNEEYLFCVRYCVTTGLKVESHSEEIKLPIRFVRACDHKWVKRDALRISDTSNETILEVIARRDRIDYEESNIINLEEQEEEDIGDEGIDNDEID